jgi:ketohexokinase
MARVLGIGVATLDVVNRVAVYPPEDAEVRADSRVLARGGNAANTLAVLAQIGHACAWAGTVADDAAGDFVLAELARQGVDTRPGVRVRGAATPTSYVTLSAATGSRTIVHWRDLREYQQRDFAALDLDGYEWLHFEGRQVADTARMLADARERRPGTPRSVEIEKPRPGIEELLPLADLVLFSRQYALARGHADAASLLARARALAPRATLVCAWGEAGAWASVPGEPPVHGPAFPPAAVVDTLGAGDVFNAGVIDALLRSPDAQRAVTAGCRLAGRKCGRSGLEGLRE